MKFTTVSGRAHIGLVYQRASPMAAVEFSEVVSLQQHVVELQEGQGLLAFQSQANAVVGHHAVDRKVRAVLSKKVEIGQLAQPLVVVDKSCVCRAVSEGQELGENARESVNIPLCLEPTAPREIRSRHAIFFHLNGVVPLQ